MDGGLELAGEALSVVEVQVLVAREVEKLREELTSTVHGLQTEVNDLSTRLAALENTR